MKRAAFGLIVLMASVCVPSSAASPADLQTYTMTHQGLTRTYYVYLPPGHARTRPAPLVLALHGGGGNGRQMEDSTNGQFIREADRRGWVVVFPEGIDKGWSDGRDPDSALERQRASVDDVGFLSQLIDRMKGDFGIDPARVYATGISNGGFMSLRLAIDLSDKVAAVAAVTASLGVGHERLTPRAPVGVLIMNGTEDPLVPYEGGQIKVFRQERGNVLSTDDTVRWWLKHLGCSGQPQISEIPDRSRLDRTRTEVETYGGCKGGVQVVLYKVIGGGHTWPGGRQYLPVLIVGRVARDFEAASEIFDFFAKHKR